jgi:hypothetical protein
MLVSTSFAVIYVTACSGRLEKGWPMHIGWLFRGGGGGGRGAARRGQFMVPWRCVFRWVQPGTALPRGAAAECHLFGFMRRGGELCVWVEAVRACGNGVPPSGSREGGQAGEARGGKGCVCARGCAWVRVGARRCACARVCGNELHSARAFCQASHPFHTRPRPAAVPPIARGDGEAEAGVPYSGLAVGQLMVGGYCMHWSTHAPHRTWRAWGAWHARPRPLPRPVRRR